MHIVATSRRRITLITAVFAVLLAVCAALFIGGRTDTAVATDAPGLNANQNICKGSITKGEADPDDPTLTTVAYRLACDQPLTGYALFVDGHPVQSLETETFGTDPITDLPVAKNAFSCNGDLPGYGVNCVGTYTGKWVVIKGTFTIEGDICAEPRVDPILTVMNSTYDSKKKVVNEAISGPFDLGRPKKAGCKATKFSGKRKILFEDAATVIQ